MATSINHGVNRMDDYTVRLVPDHNDYDSNSIDQEDLETRNGHAKHDQHRSFTTGNMPWATRRQLFYLLFFVVIIAFIVFLNLILSAVGVHKMGLIQDTSAPQVESAGLLQELQENELDYVDHFNFSENLAAEHDFFTKDNCVFTWIEHTGGPPPLSKVTVGDSSFLVVRARNSDGLIPGEAGTFLQIARYAYNESDHRTTKYQILTAPTGCVKWVEPTQPGKLPLQAVPGGIEPVTGIVLYICATTHEEMLFFGWVKKNEAYCHFAFAGATKTEDYKVLTST